MISATIALLLVLGSLLLALPVAVYGVEVLAGCWALRRRESVTPCSPRPRVAVLVPAHNEGSDIAGTIRSIQSQLLPTDGLLIVADNCTDDTARISKELGANVAERANQQQRGKGYALAFGLEQLKSDPPDVVLFFDADCRLALGTVDHLARAAHEQQRPAQALNLCEPTLGGGTQQLLSGLAFRFKNLIRMAGMSRLGGVCHLTGTGMALPWSLIERVDWATGNVVEDMQLGIDYTLAGLPPMFVPQAKVLSDLPSSDSGVLSQRRRWEHGFLQTALRQVPRLLGQAIMFRSWQVWWIALDLAVPPLALLTLALGAGWCVALMGCLMGLGFAPFAILSAASVSFVLATFVAWHQHCRDLAPAAAWLQVPRYLFTKVPLYLEFITRRQLQWNRAQRS